MLRDTDLLKPAEYMRLARQIESSRGQQVGAAGDDLDFTAELLRPYLVVECERIGCPTRPWFGPFGQLDQIVLDEQSALVAQAPDVLWIALRWKMSIGTWPAKAPLWASKASPSDWRPSASGWSTWPRRHARSIGLRSWFRISRRPAVTPRICSKRTIRTAWAIYSPSATGNWPGT